MLLQTIRSHDQFNTTIYGLDDRYRGISSSTGSGGRSSRASKGISTTWVGISLPLVRLLFARVGVTWQEAPQGRPAMF